jgi:predicted ATPase
MEQVGPLQEPLTKGHNIKSFEITGLFGDRDVMIPFDKDYKILIGENGLGKTSILNALYFTLTGRFNKLISLVFKKITLEFNSGKIVEFEKDDLVFSEDEESIKNRHEPRITAVINSVLSEYERDLIASLARNDTINNHPQLQNIYNKLQRATGYPMGILRRTLIVMFSGKSGKLEEARRTILKEIEAEILYFPTYRRIEEELHKLGALDDIRMPHDDKRLIQFGMEDVKMTLNRVIESIKNSAILGFSEITGEMLSQYLEGPPQLEPDIKDKIKVDILKIILERVGSNITNYNKERIIQLVESNEIFEQHDYNHLLNFLSKLIKTYDQQKEIDNSIKKFESINNSYLTGKKVVYDESKVTISIVQQRSNQAIELKNLSSGEKQIISLFTKIFFNEAKNIIVLFDEPELSLSMEWQKKLLPDILRSKNCQLLISVTHSPFIFDNELDEYAEDMSRYITFVPSQN